ncbi:MAG: 1-phosphofructokinase [Anaerolineae bacterium]
MILTVTPNPVLDRTLTVPNIVLNEMSRALETREDWGGKGFNVARALHALGKTSVAMGFVGGATGDKLASGLQALGIRTELTPIAGETRTNVVITDAAGEQYIKVNEPGPTVEAQEVSALMERVGTRAQPGDYWALCGSLPPGAPLDLYAQLIDRIQSRGAKALLDASGEPFRLGLEAKPFMIKPNALEAAACLERAVESPSAMAEAVEDFLARGIALVALSLGADGLMLASREFRVWARPPEVRARNPVGAGDAAVAGLLWALSEQLPPPDTARWSVASGTAAAVREGVTFGTLDEVRALYSQVRLAPWPGR